LLQIINLVRTKTAHDLSLYKSGTLQRRIARRMLVAAIGVDEIEQYLERLPPRIPRSPPTGKVDAWGSGKRFGTREIHH
jgi:hypothetical protein